MYIYIYMLIVIVDAYSEQSRSVHMEGADNILNHLSIHLPAYLPHFILNIDDIYPYIYAISLNWFLYSFTQVFQCRP